MECLLRIGLIPRKWSIYILDLRIVGCEPHAVRAGAPVLHLTPLCSPASSLETLTCSRQIAPPSAGWFGISGRCLGSSHWGSLWEILVRGSHGGDEDPTENPGEASPRASPPSGSWVWYFAPGTVLLLCPLGSTAVSKKGMEL